MERHGVKMKKRLLSMIMVAVLICSTLALAGCQKKADEGNQKEDSENEVADESEVVDESKETSENGDAGVGEIVNITFMGWGTDSEISTFEKMLSGFEDRYPNIKVEYITVPSGDFDTKLQNMIAAGEQPDAFYCPVDSFAKYAATGNLCDITDLVGADNLEDDIWQSAIDIYRYDGKSTGQGNIYALPKDVSAFPVVYNKDLFVEAGITPPTEESPWDWNDYKEAAQKLTNGDIYGTAMYSLESAVWSNGGDWLDESQTQVTFTDAKFVDALQFVADLRSESHVAPSAAEETSLSSYDRFMQGKLGMMGVGSWAMADLWNNCDFEWDIMDWPVNPDTGEKAIWFGSAGLAVSSQSEHKEEAYNLIAYLALDEESQRVAYENGQAVPTIKSMAKGEYMEFEKEPENKQAFINVLDNYGRLATQSKTFNQEWWSEFNSGLDDVYEGKVTASEYCESKKDAVQKLLDKSVEQQQELQGN